MSTSYTLEVSAGYPSFVSEKDTATYIRELLENPSFSRIFTIAMEYLGCPALYDNTGQNLGDFKGYVLDNFDTACGGSPEREIQECLQKAKLIWILEETAKRKMNVNIRFTSQ